MDKAMSTPTGFQYWFGVEWLSYLAAMDFLLDQGFTGEHAASYLLELEKEFRNKLK